MNRVVGLFMIIFPGALLMLWAIKRAGIYNALTAFGGMVLIWLYFFAALVLLEDGKGRHHERKDDEEH